MRVAALLVLSCASLLAVPRLAAQDALRPPEAVEDLRLATVARLALVADPRTRPLDVQVTARDGVVAIVGIDNLAYQRIAAALVREIPGVRGIQGLETGSDEEVGSDEGVSPPLPIPALPRVHVVERGDTLFGIARRYGIPIDDIRSLNNLSSDNIRVGQRIRLR